MSVWGSIASWLTPGVLFCVSNIMVGTIIIAASFQKQRHRPHSDSDHQTPLARSSSLLERVRSINFSLYKFDPRDHRDHRDPLHPDFPYQTTLSPSPSLLHRLKSWNFSAAYDTHDLHRSHPDSDQDHGSAPPPVFQTQLARAPSLLDRVASIKFPFSRSEAHDPDPPEIQRPAPLIDDQARVAVEPLTQAPESREQPDPEPVHHVTRVEPESGKGSAEKKMKKSVSAVGKTGVEEKEKVDKRRPATVREKGKAAMFGEDEEVDAKADDFINKFKQQLRLQRLDSLMRYKDMLNRGSAK